VIRAGVIGSPAKHSLSPIIHKAWLKEAGIDGGYRIYDIAADQFEDTVQALRAEGLAGLNVTLPFKERALALADQASPRARDAGAANVLVFREGRIEADNTDGAGLIEAFVANDFGPVLTASPVVVLGAGGAARGVVAALAVAGREIRVVNRTRARADELAASIGLNVKAYGWADLPRALTGAGALINGTSLGLEGGGPLHVDLTGLAVSAPVMDMVYKPLRTAFLQAADERGHPTIDGLDMLIGQARPSFEAFFGRRPPPAVDVRTLCLDALERRG
jgi:shikimate dehydrogenase